MSNPDFPLPLLGKGDLQSERECGMFYSKRKVFNRKQNCWPSFCSLKTSFFHILAKTQNSLQASSPAHQSDIRHCVTDHFQELKTLLKNWIENSKSSMAPRLLIRAEEHRVSLLTAL